MTTIIINIKPTLFSWCIMQKMCIYVHFQDVLLLLLVLDKCLFSSDASSRDNSWGLLPDKRIASICVIDKLKNTKKVIKSQKTIKAKNNKNCTILISIKKNNNSQRTITYFKSSEENFKTRISGSFQTCTQYRLSSSEFLKKERLNWAKRERGKDLKIKVL